MFTVAPCVYTFFIFYTILRLNVRDNRLKHATLEHVIGHVFDALRQELDTIAVKTRNSSGDEIANVNFLYDDIVHVYTTKYNRLAHRRRHRSIYALAEAVHHYKTASNVKRNLHDKLKIPSK